MKRAIPTADIAYIALFAALMAVGAWIKIVLPIGIFTVTISLQVFFAIMAGLLLGARRGFFSVAVYLLIGLLGAPVFAHGGGLSYIMKPTFGFLIGFAAAAFVAGTVISPNRANLFRRRGTAMIFAALAGEAAYYFCGLLYYYLMFNFVPSNGETIGLFELMTVWCFSTIVPDTVICLLSARLVKRVRPLLPMPHYGSAEK